MSVHAAPPPRRDQQRRQRGARAWTRARLGPRLAPAVDRELWRLAGIEVALDRSLGAALRRLQEGRRYRRLGFELWRDYVRERVGVAMRWTQYLKLLDRGCEAVPEIGAALGRGDITTWKAILLFAVVGRETGAAERSAWIARAGSCSVRRLERAVTAARLRGATGIGRAGGAASSSTEAPGTVPDPRAPDPGEWFSFRVPCRTAELWRVARETAERVSQSSLPAYRCFELLVAERFAAVGCAEEASVLAAGEAASAAQGAAKAEMAERQARVRARLGLDGDDPANEQELDEAAWSDLERLEESCRAAAAGWRFLEWQHERVDMPPDLEPEAVVDAFELDRIVQGLEAWRKEIRRLQGELLAWMQDMAGWRTLGFASLAHYTAERLGLRASEAGRLMRFAAGLAAFPELAVGYRAGRLSFMQVVLLLRVVQRGTAEAWAAWAAQRTCLATARAVEDAELFGLPGAKPGTMAAWAREVAAMGRRRQAELPDWLRGKATDGVRAPDHGEGCDGGEAPNRGAGRDCPAGGSAAPSEPAWPPDLLFWSTSAPGEPPVCIDPATLPLGSALPPTREHGRPHIVGLHLDTSGAPEPTRLEARIRFFCPAEMVSFLRAGLESCQDPDGGLMADWRRLEMLILGFLAEYLDTPEVKRLRAAFPTLERDGWICQTPVCSGRGPLHRHHAKPLGAGGLDVDWNITSLCAGHHIGHVHTMRSVRVVGRAPDGLMWQVGCRGDSEPLLRFMGEVKVDQPYPVSMEGYDMAS